MSEYKATDIQTLSPGRAFRERLGMYLSADLQEAMDLGLRELIYNAQDEYEATHQKNAYVKIQIDTDTNEITVSDNMRGIPVGVRNDGVNSLTAAFLIPHSGAKYNDKTAYSSSVGCNGEGNKIVCHTAKFLKVEVCREGNKYFQSFHETSEGAVADCDVKVIGKTKETGTKITYVPSPEVYGEKTRIDIDVLCETLQQLSYFSKGLRIILEVDGETTEFCSKHGLIDGLNKERAIGHPIEFLYSQPDCEVELALQWVGNKGDIRGYANNLFMPQGGAFISGFKSSLTKTFNSLAGRSFDGETIRNKLDGFVSVKVHIANFSNQAKTSLANPEARTATSAAITNALKEYAQKYPADFQKVIDVLTKEQKAEAAATRARESILNFEKKSSEHSKKKITSSEKFKDCEKHGQDSMLVICEGNSALNGLMPARNVQTEALYAIRGKIINLLKHPLDECLANTEVSDIINALGCGIMDKYDSKKLRFGRVAIASDGDVDGKSIGCLIATMFYVLMPEFIQEGRLCWLQAPLFRLSKGKEKVYAYSIDELNELKKTRSNWEQTRYKGLGENSPEDMKASMLHPTNRHLDILTIDDYDAFCESINILMGPQVEDRREFLFENVDFSVINR